MLKKSHWIAFMIIVGVSMALIYRYHGYLFDDAYFGFNYARQLVSGNGFVFNNGERVIGTSSPLPVLVYALISKLSGWEIPSIAKALSAMAYVWGGICCYLVFFNWSKSRFWSLLGWSLVYTNMWIVLLFSHETMIYLMNIWAAIYLFQEKRFSAINILLGVGMLVRQETVILWGILSLLAFYYYKTTHKSLKPWLYSLGAGLMICGAWYLFSWQYFGTIVSQSAVSKSVQTLVGIQPYYRGFLFSILDSIKISPAIIFYYGAWTILVLECGRYLIKRRDMSLNIVCLWAVLTTLFYLVMGVPYYHWFGVQIYAVIAMIYTLGVRQIITDKSQYKIIKVVVGLLLIAAIVTNLGLTWKEGGSIPTKQSVFYRDLGLWLKDNTPTDASTCYGEVGMIKYYSERGLVDYIGMVSPGSIKYLVKKDFKGLLGEYRPDYFIYTDGFKDITGDLPKQEWFGSTYVEVKTFEPDTFPHTTTIYERIK